MSDKQLSKPILVVFVLSVILVIFSVLLFLMTIVLNKNQEIAVENSTTEIEYTTKEIVAVTEGVVITTEKTTVLTTSPITETTTKKVPVNNYPNTKGYKGSQYITSGNQYYNAEGKLRTVPRITIDTRDVYEFEELINEDVEQIIDKNDATRIVDGAYLDYNSYQNGDVLSLLFESGYDGHTTYRNINIDVTTGRALSPEAVAVKSGISMDYFNSEFNKYYFEHSEPSVYINEDGYVVIIYYSQTEVGLVEKTKVLF